MDLLSNILSTMKLNGTLYFRTSFTAPWGVEVPSYSNVARFHYAHQGRCLVRVGENEPVFLEQGDLVVIPGGAGHILYCEPNNEKSAVKLDRVLEESGFDGTGALVYGEPGGHHETQLVCGHFAFSEDVEHLLINALPDHIHVRNYGDEGGAWLEQTLKVIGNEAGKGKLGSDLIAYKMSEIIFTQVLRVYLQNEGKDRPVMAGFADPKIARALSAIHEEPGNSWTLENLAQLAGMSRTAFSTRFTQCLTITPINYLTHWRMQLAKQMLGTGQKPIIEIAEEVGYQSEAAFGRVFKKYHENAPATYRRLQQSA